MKKSLWMFVVVSALAGFALAEPVVVQQSESRPNIFAPAATPSGPLVDVVNSIVMAFNNQDKTIFRRSLRPTPYGLMKTGIIWQQ
jgi:hypothetical protein